MEKLRFATALDLFQAYPTAAADVGAPATAEPALDYVKALTQLGNLLGAVSFCAYLLSRREAVWWACQGVRALPSTRHPADLPPADLPPADLPPADLHGLEAAEAWVHEPDEAHRLAAHRAALLSDARSPASWAAFAAAFAGQVFGSAEFGPVAIPTHLTARAARTVFLLASGSLSPPVKDEYLRACLDRAVGLAERR
jgi:hypothetical protein